MTCQPTEPCRFTLKIESAPITKKKKKKNVPFGREKSETSRSPSYCLLQPSLQPMAKRVAFLSPSVPRPAWHPPSLPPAPKQRIPGGFHPVSQKLLLGGGKEWLSLHLHIGHRKFEVPRIPQRNAASFGFNISSRSPPQKIASWLKLTPSNHRKLDSKEMSPLESRQPRLLHGKIANDIEQPDFG